jgi:hypothetical protein
MKKKNIKGCRNCAFEGGENTGKCLKKYVKEHLSEGGKGCLDHQWRDGWDLEGTIFDES